jgi:hypothetical protein
VILGFSALLLLSLFVGDVAAQTVQVSLVTTNDCYYGIPYGYERAIVYAKGRHWVFYWQSSGGAIKYISSSTGTGEWGNGGTIDTNMVSGFSVWYDNVRDFLHIAYSGGYPLYYRRITLNADGTLTLGTRYQIFYDAYHYAYYPSVSVDTNGYPYVGWWAPGTDVFSYVSRSSTNDGTWSTPSGYPVRLGGGTYPSPGGPVALAPLPNGYMYAIRIQLNANGAGAAKTMIYGHYTSGTSTWTFDGVLANIWDAYTTYPLWVASLVSDSAGNIHFAYRHIDQSVIYYCKRTAGYPGGSWGSVETVQSSVFRDATYPYLGSDPVLSLLPDGRLACFWIGLSSYPNRVYLKMRSSAGVWDTNPTLVSDEAAAGFQYRDYATGFAYATSDNKIGFAYTTNPQGDNPYNIKYALVSISNPEVTSTSTATSFIYASSTAKITSTTTVTNLLSTTSTRSTTTLTTSTAPPVTSTVQSPTTTYSTTLTTARLTTSTAAQTMTTTSYAGPSSTTTILTTTGTSIATIGTSTTSATTTVVTTTVTSYSTSYATAGTTISYSTTSSTVLTGTTYTYSTTTIGTVAATTLTTTVGTTATTQTGATNTVLIIYTEQRNVVTTYTESIQAFQSVLGRLDFDVLETQIFSLIETASTSFFELIQNILTDVVTFFEQTLFGVLEQVRVYEPMSVQIIIDSNPLQGSGFVKVDGGPVTTPCTFNWKWGEIHQIEALSPVSGGPGIQYAFTSWSDGGAQSHMITVQSPMTITATYQLQYQLTIQVANPAKGTTDPAPGNYWYNSGSNVPVAAQPTPGNQLSHWELDGVSVGSANPYTVLMDAPHTLKAIFEASQVAVTITSYPMGEGYLIVDGSPITTPYSTSWQQRSTHTLKANARVGNWRFKEWSDGNRELERTVQVSGDSWSIQAIYSIQHQLTISINPSDLSSTNPPPGTYWYDAGAVVTLTAQPVAGFDFKCWKLNGVSQGDGGAEIQIQMDKDYVAVAWYNFKRGEVAQPAVSFDATPPYVISLMALAALSVAIVTRRHPRRPRDKITITLAFSSS